MVVRGVRDRGKILVVEWEASVDVYRFTVAFIRTRRRKRRTWDTPFLGYAPFVPRVSVGLHPRHMCRLVIKSWNTVSRRNRK